MKQVETKQATTFREQNQAAIEPAIQQVKIDTQEQLRQEINQAIQDTLQEFELDLTEGEESSQVPYLNETEMAAFRKEMIEAARTYAESRIK